MLDNRVNLFGGFYFPEVAVDNHASTSCLKSAGLFAAFASQMGTDGQCPFVIKRTVLERIHFALLLVEVLGNGNFVSDTRRRAILQQAMTLLSSMGVQ
ncbi:MAG: hypothetical protein AB7E51_15045 [Pseudodesulfovibrio sp.]